MAFTIAFARNLIVAAALCASVLLSATQVTADRDESKYLNRLRNKRFKRSVSSNQTRIGDDGGGAGGIRIRPKKSTRTSLLTRSFILASIVWIIKFVMPNMSRWVSRLCRNISDFKRSLSTRAKEIRRHRKEKSQINDEGGDEPSISPSVMSILDMSDVDDDGSSFISATSSISSVSTYLGSIVRRARFTRIPRSSPAPERFGSSHHSTNRPKLSKSQSKTSKKEPSRRKQQQPQDSAIPNTLPKFLHFIEEDQVSNLDAALGEKLHHPKKHQGNNTSRNNEWLDDISHVPTTGNIHTRKQHEYTTERPPNSPLERKLSAGSSHDSNDNAMNDYSHQNHSRHEKHNRQRHHHRRDRHK